MLLSDQIPHPLQASLFPPANGGDKPFTALSPGSSEIMLLRSNHRALQNLARGKQPIDAGGTIDTSLQDHTHRHSSVLFDHEILIFFNFLFYIEVQLINNVVLVSGVQQSDSV